MYVARLLSESVITIETITYKNKSMNIILWFSSHPELLPEVLLQNINQHLLANQIWECNSAVV